MFDKNFLQLRKARAQSSPPGSDFLRIEASRGLVAHIEATGRQFANINIVGDERGCLRRALLDLQPFRQSVNPKYDLIASLLQLHWESDPMAKLVDFRNKLRKDGFFVGVLFGEDTLIELRSVLTQAEDECENGASPRIVPMGNLHDFADVMVGAGFADVVTDLDRFTLLYPSMRDLMREIGKTGEANAISARHRGPLKRKTLMRAEEIYREFWTHKSGKISATVDLCYLSGWRK